MTRLAAFLLAGTVLLVVAAPAHADDEGLPVDVLIEHMDGDSRVIERADATVDVPEDAGEAYTGEVSRRSGRRCCGHRFLRIEGGLAFMADPEGPLGVDTGAANQIVWDENELDSVSALRAYAGMTVGRGRIEAGGTWYGSFEGDSAQTGVFGFAPPPGSSSATTPAALDTEIDLWTAHATWWCPLRTDRCSTLSWGVGVRSIYFREVATADGLTIPGGGAGSIESDAENRFIGAELGVRYERRMGARWTLDAYALGLAGAINRDLSVRDTAIFAPGAHRSTSEDDEFAWGVNAGVRLGYRLSRSLTLTGGYDLLFLDGVVRGHDAIDTTQAGTGAVQARQREGDLLAHAIFVGLELRL